MLPAIVNATKKGYIGSLSVSSTSAWGMQLNDGLCAALTARDSTNLTHILFLHSDLVPMTLGWLDILVDEAIKYDADILSAVSRIKDESGDTSTAIETENPYAPTRLSMADVHKEEVTFTKPGLLVNNGCMLINLHKPWVQKAEFNITVGINNNRQTYFFSEDWQFSRDAREGKWGEKAKVYATRAIELHHWGMMGYSNQLAKTPQEKPF
jgi:hypothetical protein